MRFKPFADDERSIGIGDLTIENGTNRVALYGSLDLTRDKAGQKRARELLELVQEAVRNLPDTLPPPPEPEVVDNSFR